MYLKNQLYVIIYYFYFIVAKPYESNDLDVIIVHCEIAFEDVIHDD